MKNEYGIRQDSSTITIVNTYNDVYSNSISNYKYLSAGLGDISVGVSFVDEENGDYREVDGSPTIDAGDPADDWTTEPHPHGGRINMGAFGNTLWATKSPPLRITTTTLSDGETNAGYNASISTVGGSPPVTFSVVSGSLPPGLTLTSATGIISGEIPVGSAGEYKFQVKVVDTGSAEDTRDFGINVRQAMGNDLRITVSTLSDGEENALYSAFVTVAGGFLPYSWVLQKGELPQGLALNTESGEIRGIPQIGTKATYIFTIKVTDKDSYSVSREITLTINEPPQPLVPGKRGGGHGGRCFIATAAYSVPFEPAVKILCRFRDEYLGEKITAIYYKYSPPIAEYIANNKWAKLFVQIILVPFVGYSWFMVETGLFVKIVVSLLLATICANLIIRKWKRRLVLS
jgi:hypothetical protein